ncbi:MAG: type II toxin-antitoxin system VapC family toxin [Acidobacteria bacterium]|nr:type II toxin-antitoxin system VapC family toxin [Acidobacteriota bacterium]
MFWDASAIVPLAFEEPRSGELLTLAGDSPIFSVWWGTPLECAAAAYRKRREGRVDLTDFKRAIGRLHAVLADATFVVPTDTLRHRAEHLVAVYPLRAGDALQLAAALIKCEEQPWNEAFVCLDTRLREAARQEGFSVLPEELA